MIESTKLEKMVNLAKRLDHPELVGKLMEWMASEGFEVYCASEGYKRCESIDGYVPDCMARGKGLIAIGEAKTAGEIGSERTREEIRIGANGTTNTGGWKDQLIPFYIVIPSGCEEELRRILKGLGYLGRSNIKVGTCGP